MNDDDKKNDETTDQIPTYAESGFGPAIVDVVREREMVDRTERLISAIERLTEAMEALLERESDE